MKPQGPQGFDPVVASQYSQVRNDVSPLDILDRAICQLGYTIMEGGKDVQNISDALFNAFEALRECDVPANYTAYSEWELDRLFWGMIVLKRATMGERTGLEMLVHQTAEKVLELIGH